MKKILIVIGIILALGVTAAGSFYGGMRYQANQTQQIQNNFFASRGGQPSDGQFPNAGNGSSGFNRQGGQFSGNLGGASGTIKSIDGNVMTVSTAQDVTTVNLSDSTPVQETVAGSIADLQPGMRVRIIGQADSSGAITAEQVVVLNDSQNGAFPFGPGAYPAPGQGQPTPTP